jgi:EmrB/QacA subfamily drug resistance transporter
VIQSASIRPRIIAAGLLTSFLSALDTTILSTVMPTIAADLGGLSLYSWVFAVYMVVTAVSMPIWGKLSDMLGRKRLFITAVMLFLAGSMLCGLARSMTQLILFRGIQGIGGGGLAAVPFAMISAFYPPHERGKVLGILSSAWGISSVIGPMLGSTIVATLSWPWVFYINLPLGVIAIVLVARYHPERHAGAKEPIDYAGAFLLTGTILFLLLTARSIGQAGWSWGVAVQASVACAFLVGFITTERGAKNPILALSFFTRRSFWLGNLLGFLSSFAMFGIIAFLPLFAQTVLGGTAVQAGLLVTPMSLAWSVMAIVAGRAVPRVGENALIRGGMLSLALGLVLLLFTHYDSSLGYLIFCVVLAGIGMGSQTAPLTLSVQQSLAQKDLGVATSAQMLSRTIGGAIGVSILGAVLTGTMANNLTEGIARGTLDLPRDLALLVHDPQKLLALDVRAQLSPAQVTFVLQAFTDAMHRVVLGCLSVVLLAMMLNRFLPPSSLHLHHRQSPSRVGK